MKEKSIMFDANTYRDEAENVRVTHRHNVESITNSVDLNIDAKQRLIAEARQTSEQKLADIRRREDKAREDRVTDLRRRLVGRPIADTASEISWRDAADRVERIDNEETAITVLRQAIDNADKPLIRTILRAGYDRGWAEVINTYTAAHRLDYDDAEELWSLTYNGGANGNDLKAKLYKDLAFTL